MSSKWIPSGSQIMREAIIVMAGAALAALVVNVLLPPEYRKLFAMPTRTD